MSPFVKKYIVGFYDENRPITVLYARTLFLSLALCVFWLAVFWASRILGFKVDFGFVQIDMNRDNFVEYFCQEFSKFMFFSILFSIIYFSANIFSRLKFFSKEIMLLDKEIAYKLKRVYMSNRFKKISNNYKIVLFSLCSFFIFLFIPFFITPNVYIFLNDYIVFSYINNFSAQTNLNFFIFTF